MTDVPACEPSTSADAHLPEQATGTARQPYRSPHVPPPGHWTALTLVTSLPTGPGGMVLRWPDERLIASPPTIHLFTFPDRGST